MEGAKPRMLHKIILENRQKGILTGVLEVRSFDEDAVSLLTEGGKLLIKGEKLHMGGLNLEKGELEIDGRVHSIVYLSKGNGKKRKLPWRR